MCVCVCELVICESCVFCFGYCDLSREIGRDERESEREWLMKSLNTCTRPQIYSSFPHDYLDGDKIKFIIYKRLKFKMWLKKIIIDIFQSSGLHTQEINYLICLNIIYTSLNLVRYTDFF